MTAKYLDIKSMMKAVDTRNKKWFDDLSEDDKKLYSPYMTMKWSASVKNPDYDYQMYYVSATNKYVNKHLWALSKNHKSLLWKLTSLCGAGMIQFHEWIYPKKKKTTEKSKIKELQMMFPNAKQKDLDVYEATLSTKEFKDLKQQYGLEQ